MASSQKVSLDSQCQTSSGLDALTHEENRYTEQISPASLLPLKPSALMKNCSWQPLSLLPGIVAAASVVIILSILF